MKEIQFPCKIFKASVVSGEGIEEGVSWLSKTMKRQIEEFRR